MAIVFRNGQNATASTTTSVTLSNYDGTQAIRVGSVLVVSVQLYEQGGTVATVSDVTYNSISLTKADGVLHDISGHSTRCEVWYVVNPSVIADIVVTVSGSTDELEVQAVILDGAVAQAPEATNTGTDTATPWGPHSVTSVTNRAYILSAIIVGGDSTGLTQTETDQVDEAVPGRHECGRRSVIETTARRHDRHSGQRLEPVTQIPDTYREGGIRCCQEDRRRSVPVARHRTHGIRLPAVDADQ